MSTLPMALRTDRPVSILVFVELALDEKATYTHLTRGLTEFQSLFSWNLLLMEERAPTLEEEEGSFNPCFRGTCS